jgi:hypothetical protein
MGDGFQPCEIWELEDGTSLLNEPAVDIPLRRQLLLHAVLRDVQCHTEVLAARLESGVRCCSDGQRDSVRRLYLATRRQLEAIATALDLLSANC